MKAGLNYRESKRTIAINILDYELFEEGPYHEVARLKRDYKNKIVTNKIEFHFIQIPKFIKEKNLKGTKLEQWMNYISQKNEEVVKMAIEENKEIKKANEDYEYLTGEEAERRIAFLIEKARKDEVTMREGSREEGIEIGRKEGKEQGIQEGREEGARENKIEIAKNMLKRKMDLEVIAEITGLSIKEIQKIQKEMEI